MKNQSNITVANLLKFNLAATVAEKRIKGYLDFSHKYEILSTKGLGKFVPLPEVWLENQKMATYLWVKHGPFSLLL